MEYEYFTYSLSKWNEQEKKFYWIPLRLVRIKGLDADWLRPNGEWARDLSGDTAGAIKLGMSGWDDFFEVTAEEAERFKKAYLNGEIDAKKLFADEID